MPENIYLVLYHRIDYDSSRLDDQIEILGTFSSHGKADGYLSSLANNEDYPNDEDLEILELPLDATYNQPL